MLPRPLLDFLSTVDWQVVWFSVSFVGLVGLSRMVLIMYGLWPFEDDDD